MKPVFRTSEDGPLEPKCDAQVRSVTANGCGPNTTLESMTKNVLLALAEPLTIGVAPEDAMNEVIRKFEPVRNRHQLGPPGVHGSHLSWTPVVVFHWAVLEPTH